MNSSFEKLIRRNGGYSLPYLIHIYGTYLSDGSEHEVSLYLINDTEALSYDGHVYKASAFTYKSGVFEYGFSGGGTLSIAADEENLFELIDAGSALTLDVTGVIDEDGEVTELRSFSHSYGKVSVSRTQLDFTFDKDERLSMTFPTLVWSAQNNRGNS